MNCSSCNGTFKEEELSIDPGSPHRLLCRKCKDWLINMEEYIPRPGGRAWSEESDPSWMDGSRENSRVACYFDR